MAEADPKRRKVDKQHVGNDHLQNLKTVLCGRNNEIELAIKWLSSTYFLLEPLKFKNSNAADSNTGYSFSNAYCDMATVSESYPFFTFFENGIRILRNAFAEPSQFPENLEERLLLLKLLEYFVDKGNQSSLAQVHVQTGAGITVLLAEHLLSRLTSCDQYTIDDHYSRPVNCPCCECDASIDKKCGDTSIGHSDVWHGNPDLLLEREEVAVLAFEDDLVDGSDSSGELSAVEDLNKGLFQSFSQLIAQTIVFSFLQKSLHPTLSNHLIPTIGISRTDVVFFFYDSEKDVLLRSERLPLFANGKLFPASVAAIWLVLNYKYFCNGLLNYSNSIEKADFFENARSKLNVYEKDLHYKGVESRKPTLVFENLPQVRQTHIKYPVSLQRFEQEPP